jgi:hypothetical protein
MNLPWKEREPAIKALVPDFLRALVVLEKQAPVTVRMFFCDGVMAIVKYLREATNAKDIGATHHVFKILGKHAMYGDRGRLEFADKGERADIYFEDTMVTISVKALVMATIKVIRGTAMAVFDAVTADKTWIFFFYKFKGRASPRPPCQHLIAWIEIDSLDIDPARTTKQVITMVTKAKQKAAKLLGVPAKILVPVPNIIKVDDMEREIAEKDKIIADARETLAEKDKTLAEERRASAEKDKTLAEERLASAEKDEEIAALKKQIGKK